MSCLLGRFLDVWSVKASYVIFCVKLNKGSLVGVKRLNFEKQTSRRQIGIHSAEGNSIFTPIFQYARVINQKDVLDSAYDISISFENAS